MTPGATDLESFRSALAEFDRHAEDVLRANSGSFENTLQRLIAFQSANPFTYQLFGTKLKVLHYEAFMMETSRLRGTMSNLGRLDWPVETEERVGFQTRLLTDLANRRLSLLDLLHDFYSQTGDVTRDLRVFQEQLLHPYLRDYRLLLTTLEPKPSPPPPLPAPLAPEDRYDIFISHASEDKDDFVRPLAAELARLGLRVWFDELTLKIGDGLRNRIDDGLSRSTYGVVVLSRDFFTKHWPEAELGGLFALEMEGRKVILPVWHRVTKKDVLEYSPMLADKMAAKTDEGVAVIAARIYEVARPLDRTFTVELAKARAQATILEPRSLSELLHTISDVAPLLYKLDEPLAGADARIFLGALQAFFCGVNLLTPEIDKDLRFGADNLLRVMSQVHEPKHHQAYLFGKLGTARNSFEAYRACIKIGFELEPIDVSQPLGVGMHRLHAALGDWLEEEKKFGEDDRSVVRLVVALLDYGRRQHGPQQPFPSISPAIHQSLRATLTQLLARHLNLAVPDQLENILTTDVKGYCGHAWEELEDFEFGQARKARRILLDWFFSRMPWKRAKRVRPGDLIA